MNSDFTQRVSSLTEKDQDILACANALGISPLSIEKVVWQDSGPYPQPLVSVRIHTVIKSSWREGKFPWTKENLPQKSTKDIEEFIQRQAAVRKWPR